jgi:hypothetical protein
MKKPFIQWVIVMLAAVSITACDSNGSNSEPDAGGEVGRCDPSTNCCTDEGIWRTDCEYRCNMETGDCWPECNPGSSCCEIDGTECLYGCDDRNNCYRDCNPSDICCELNGTWTPDKVRQPFTAFFWKRCPLGQVWDLETCDCTGTPSSMMWCEAMGEPTETTTCSAVPSTTNMCESTHGEGYRLPAGDDYKAVLGNCSDGGVPNTCDSCADSEDCTDMFGTDTNWYWSSTSFDIFSSRYADFGDGGVDDVAKDTVGNVRCIRTGW